MFTIRNIEMNFEFKRKFEDLSGKTFGRLTVLRRVHNSVHGQVQFLCRCTCGTENIVAAYSLKRGKTTSCGCIRSENMHKLNEERREALKAYRSSQKN